MSKIYKTAEKNFEEAAKILNSFLRTRIDVRTEAEASLVKRNRVGLISGYNAITKQFAVCLSPGGRAEILKDEDGLSIKFRSRNVEWVTFEASLNDNLSADFAYIEMKISKYKHNKIEIFLRDFHGSSSLDNHTSQWLDLKENSVCMLKIPLPPRQENITGRKIIIYFQDPNPEFLLEYLTIS